MITFLALFVFAFAVLLLGLVGNINTCTYADFLGRAAAAAAIAAYMRLLAEATMRDKIE